MAFLVSKIKDLSAATIYRLNKRLTDKNKIDEMYIDDVFDNTFTDFLTMYFVSCFSDERDMLEQWKGYANMGCGVSIGFSTTVLHRLTGIKHKYLFTPVEYHFESYSNKFQEELRTFADNLDDTPNIRDDLGQFLYKTMTFLLSQTCRYKNPSFSSEREWRLIYNPYGMTRRLTKTEHFVDHMNELKNPSDYGNGFIRKPISFEVKNNKIRSYIDLDFSKVKNELIKEIVIGNNTQIDDADLVLLLSTYGYSLNGLKISKSSIPLT